MTADEAVRLREEIRILSELENREQRIAAASQVVALVDRILERDRLRGEIRRERARA